MKVVWLLAKTHMITRYELNNNPQLGIKFLIPDDAKMMGL